MNVYKTVDNVEVESINMQCMEFYSIHDALIHEGFTLNIYYY